MALLGPKMAELGRLADVTSSGALRAFGVLQHGHQLERRVCVLLWELRFEGL